MTAGEHEVDEQAEGPTPGVSSESARHPFRMLLQGVFDDDELGDGELEEELPGGDSSAGPASSTPVADA